MKGDVNDLVLHWAADHWVGRFSAMASPCEVLVDSDDRALADRLVQTAAREARRIERKFSRYRTDSVIHRINHSDGQPFEVDAETANLLDYAARCHALSAGRFDVSSGVLRRAWRFDGSDNLPTPEAVAALLPLVGWRRIGWQRPWITVPKGMEIDLGGIGKEYAVDRVAQLLGQHTDAGLVVNFGGDLAVTGARRNGSPWSVAIEQPGDDARPLQQVLISAGGLATSGDSRRYVLKDGVRYGHILDPHTGWPVPDAHRSVTVAAGTCLEAGMLATFAILQGREADNFLRAQQVPFWLDH